MKLIEELYSSDLSAGDPPASYWQERGDVDRLLELRTAELLAGLTESQKKLFRSIERRFDERMRIGERCAFQNGFRLGVRLMNECFAEDA